MAPYLVALPVCKANGMPYFRGSQVIFNLPSPASGYQTGIANPSYR